MPSASWYPAVILLGVQYRKTPESASASGRGLFETAVVQYLEGLAYLRNNRQILVTALHKGGAALVFSSGYQVVKVVIGRSLFPWGRSRWNQPGAALLRCRPGDGYRSNRRPPLDLGPA